MLIFLPFKPPIVTDERMLKLLSNMVTGEMDIRRTVDFLRIRICTGMIIYRWALMLISNRLAKLFPVTRVWLILLLEMRWSLLWSVWAILPQIWIGYFWKTSSNCMLGHKLFTLTSFYSLRAVYLIFASPVKPWHQKIMSQVVQGTFVRSLSPP